MSSSFGSFFYSIMYILFRRFTGLERDGTT